MRTQAKMYATTAHKDQTRKLTNEPYISHPIRVAKILEENGASEELICAGYLHDVIEDTNMTIEQIEAVFGKRVRDLVLAHTEDKSLPWKDRKETTIEQIKRGSRDIKWLIVADKLDNLLDIEEAYKHMGEAIWEQFNAGKSEQYWYFSSIAQYMFDELEEKDIPPFFYTYERLVKNVFK